MYSCGPFEDKLSTLTLWYAHRLATKGETLIRDKAKPKAAGSLEVKADGFERPEGSRPQERYGKRSGYHRGLRPVSMCLKG